MNWMIYGANGYTGELIAREAKYRGLKPILAGRSADKVAALATELDCECRVFGIGNPDEMARQLQGVALVLHCAGPFSATSAPMITACLKARAHYLDITGEISVFEHAQTRNAEAQQAGVVVCPGVGFDVIPTDCVAAALKQALPTPPIWCWASIHDPLLPPARPRPSLRVWHWAARCAATARSCRCRWRPASAK